MLYFINKKKINDIKSYTWIYLYHSRFNNFLLSQKDIELIFYDYVK